MPKFSVTINDSARHVVSAKSVPGALKIAIDAIHYEDPTIFVNGNAEISVREIPQRYKHEEAEVES